MCGQGLVYMKGIGVLVRAGSYGTDRPSEVRDNKRIQDAHSARMGNSVLHFHPAPQSQCQPSAGTSVPSASLRLAPQCPAPRRYQVFFFTTGYHRSFFTHHNMPHRRSFPCPAPARTFTWGPGKGPVASGVPMRRSIFTCNASREGLLT